MRMMLSEEVLLALEVIASILAAAIVVSAPLDIGFGRSSWFGDASGRVCETGSQRRECQVIRRGGHVARPGLGLSLVNLAENASEGQHRGPAVQEWDRVGFFHLFFGWWH